MELKMSSSFIVTQPVQTPKRWSAKALATDFLGQKLNTEDISQVVLHEQTAHLPSASFSQQELLPLRAGLSLPEFGGRKSDSLWTLVQM